MVIINENFDKKEFGLKKGLKIIFSDPLFIIILIVKLFFSIFFISSSSLNNYIPFLEYFSKNPFINPYQIFTNTFPHPQLMLLILGAPFLVFSFLSNSLFFSSLLLKIPILVADILILLILFLLIPRKKKTIMLLYWMSPIIFFINYIYGEPDLIPISLLILSFYYLSKNRNKASSITLGIALATKTSLILILPFFFLYLVKKKFNLKQLTIFFSIIFLIYLISLLPFLSKGFVSTVYGAPSHLKILDLSINFSDGILFFVIPALYLYLMFKTASFKKITKGDFFMLTGVTFSFFVTLIAPPPSWYVWSIPFIIYSFIQHKKISKTLYWSFNLFFILYILFIPNPNILEVLQLIGPSFTSINSIYFYINEIGLNSQIILSSVFTLLSANLFYISYLMYRESIRTSLLFQEKGGIPVIGLTGDSGSGKTTTAKALLKLFGNERTNLICGDDVHRWERGHPQWKNLTHLNPLSNRIHLHHNQILNLKKGYTILRPKYDHNTGKFTKPLIVKPKELIIDEGLHTFFIHGQKLHTLRIYMDPSPSLKHYWKIKRDVEERGYSKKQVFESIRKRKKDSTKYIFPQKESQDIIYSLQTNKSISYYAKNKKNPEYYLEIYINSSLNVENLINRLIHFSQLKIRIDYPNSNYQRIQLKGKLTNLEARTILHSFDLDYSEYGVKDENLIDGIEGIIQLFTLYCLDQRLLQKYKMEGER